MVCVVVRVDEPVVVGVVDGVDVAVDVGVVVPLVVIDVVADVVRDVVGVEISHSTKPPSMYESIMALTTDAEP